jgi:hypothetical protein
VQTPGTALFLIYAETVFISQLPVSLKIQPVVTEPLNNIFVAFKISAL